MGKSDKNNSVTDTKGRMQGNQVLRQGTSWLANREGHSVELRIILLLVGSMKNEGGPSTGKGTMLLNVADEKWREIKDVLA